MTPKVKAKVTTANSPAVAKVASRGRGAKSSESSSSKVEAKLSKAVKKIDVKERAQRAGRTMTTRVSAKNQITIPVDILRKAGFKVGDSINCAVMANGTIALSRQQKPILSLAGIGTGLYDNFDLEVERDSWEK